ncbi:two-component system, OmpR family, sensor histidine kinase KdpD [Paenibacillus sp. UNC496MF]|uniref:universal stress protein n=1 Tax=Paenibacillus sp. UNC496MF TaxID=1502753 RepID=UPI0008F3198D|nr:universal stress protein [Paenibacillus sp. UNC496MF]SFJ84275.1 two-component system, OmpR family, sensor histidine kinase KdpD [Paenibacillus sp. UNC496MF]
MGGFRRKTPEEILQSISKLHRGTLKIYIGPVSGSGKTYHMLREGQTLLQQGVDVVICAVSTLQRKETVEQLGELERVPSIHWYREQLECKDLNLDALLERNPEVVLVDGLAHRNREGARFRTRLEDIKFLLGHGISVITTVNVYELEGYTELAQKLTGIEVKHTVPADTLELADEVRLIDVTPETILNRLAEGHLNGSTDLPLFKRGNLGVLRELALRLVAEDVGDSLREYREELGLDGPAGTGERILVSAQYHWNGSIYVRRGQQIAKRLNGDLLVVTFRNMKRALSKEAAVFRRSIIKLAEKVDGEFEELPFRSRRQIPKTIVDYAAAHGVTRIVMGHTKHTRWQELLQGSVVNQILKRATGIDVFLVADRSEREGERVLPANIAPAAPPQPYRRLSEQEVTERIGEIKRGRFKVYIGAAPGVGKTYTMLREGNDLLRKGIDVRIGLLETHGRRDTIEQVGTLPSVARERILYQGVELEEMDTKAIIAASPEVVLVDELAHTNVPGSRNKKRYEDVLEILDAGISVITTVNVQHLESLNDAVEQITGIRVRETVPDSILQLANEVQLIDVAPEALRNRMREGKIYAMAKVDQALSNFFKTGNLIALRELALREIADDVDERLESLERKSSLRGPWRRREAIFVCVNNTPYAKRLVRRGFRTAYRLKAPWCVNYVQVGSSLGEQERRQLETLELLTVKLGGTFVVHRAESRKAIASVLSAKADEAEATQLIIGQSKLPWWSALRYGSVVKKLIALSRYRDILVVADYGVKEGEERRSR